MKNSVNPLAIGMFVLGAAVLATATVILYGASKFFSDSELFVSYFTESVNGLDIGAPLKYRGVQIGKVESISITAPIKGQKEGYVAVVCSIDSNTLKRKTGKKVSNFTGIIRSQIEDGLRSKLNYQSIVTGMLYVELDYFAEKNAKYDIIDGGFPYPEVPSVPTGLSEIAKNLQASLSEISRINFKEIATNANKLIVTVNSKLEPIDTAAMSAASIKMMTDIDALATDKELKDAVKNLNKLLVTSNTEVQGISASTRKAMANMDKTLENINSLLDPDSPFRYEVSTMLRSLDESMTALTNLLEYLERNPNALFTGRNRDNEDEK